MAEYAEDKMCTCGCPASEHHQVWYRRGGHTYDECEHWGWNEFGGCKPVHDEDGSTCEHAPRCDATSWVNHCDHFTPVAIPLGQHANS
jgi:hypothetical protein